MKTTSTSHDIFHDGRLIGTVMPTQFRNEKFSYTMWAAVSHIPGKDGRQLPTQAAAEAYIMSLVGL